MNPTILITRPLQQALETQAKLSGYKCEIMPLLEIQYNDFSINDEGYSYYVITSQNAASALVLNSKKFIKKPLLIVGAKSAKILQDNGYKLELVAQDAKSLFEYMISKTQFSKESKINAKLLYLCGDHVAFPLAEKLSSLGIKIDAVEVYKSIEVQHRSSLPRVEIVLFYSPRTARIFAKNFKSLAAGMTAICISKDTAKEIEHLGFDQVKIATYPDEDSIIELL